MGYWLSGLVPSETRHSNELLIEQYTTLRRQIPLMYALMFINVLFLGIDTFRDVPLGMSFGIPLALSASIVARAVIWVRRRAIIATPRAAVFGRRSNPQRVHSALRIRWRHQLLLLPSGTSARRLFRSLVRHYAGNSSAPGFPKLVLD